MTLVAKALRVAAAVLNAAADLQDAKQNRPPSSNARTARRTQQFDRQMAWQAERARRTSLLIGLSHKIGEAASRRTWDSLRSIAPCPRCNEPYCTCR